MNGKLRINLNGKEIRLWFNKFSQLKAMEFFGVKSKDTAKASKQLNKAMDERLKESQLLLVCDLIWLGVFGQATAYNEDYQMDEAEIRLGVADIDLEDIEKVSKSFIESMTRDIKKQTKQANKGKSAKKK